jgi:hypothetical protein
MITSETQATSPSPAATAAQPTPVHGHGFNFHEFLSDINPLQYLPVVGTIYRAVTGDVIPEALREGGSFLVSGLLGGPIGLLTSIAETIAEKITGIDPEKIVASVFHTSTPAVAEPAATDPVLASTSAGPGQANTPAGAGQASTPAGPGQASTPAGPGQASTPTGPGQASAPADPVLAGTPAAPRIALTPEQLSAYGIHPDASGIPKRADTGAADVLNTIELTRLGHAAAAYAANQPPALTVAAIGG